MKKLIWIIVVIFAFTAMVFTSDVIANHNSGNKYKCQNNGWGNGDQVAPGKSGSKNNAENGGVKKSDHNKDKNKDKYKNKTKCSVKKCEKANKYLLKSQTAKKEKYAKKYYEKYLKYSKYCPTTEPPNNAPVASDGNYVVTVGEQRIITLIGSDKEDNVVNLKFVIVSQPTYGTLVDNGNGTVFYSAPAQITVDTFTFKVIDSKGKESNVSTITINVQDATDI